MELFQLWRRWRCHRPNWAGGLGRRRVHRYRADGRRGLGGQRWCHGGQRERRAPLVRALRGQRVPRARPVRPALSPGQPETPAHSQPSQGRREPLAPPAPPEPPARYPGRREPPGRRGARVPRERALQGRRDPLAPLVRPAPSPAQREPLVPEVRRERHPRYRGRRAAPGQRGAPEPLQLSRSPATSPAVALAPLLPRSQPVGRRPAPIRR